MLGKLHERSPAPSCGDCAYWRSRHHHSALAPADIAAREDAALAAGSPQPQGFCWLMPTPVPRNREDLCGQHSAIEAERREALAEALIRIVKEG